VLNAVLQAGEVIGDLLLWLGTTTQGQLTLAVTGILIEDAWLAYHTVAEWYAAAHFAETVEAEKDSIAQAAADAKAQNSDEHFREMLRRLVRTAGQLDTQNCDRPPVIERDDKNRKIIGVKIAGKDTPPGRKFTDDTDLWDAFKNTVPGYTREHVIPAGLGGRGTDGNLIPLTENANEVQAEPHERAAA